MTRTAWASLYASADSAASYYAPASRLAKTRASEAQPGYVLLQGDAQLVIPQKNFAAQSSSVDYPALFARHGLGSFEALWNLNLPHVDAPNQSRTGWSTVSRLELADSEGRPVRLYLKRQSNYLTRSLRHPFGEPTCAREFRAIQSFQKLGIPTVEPAYFEQHSVRGEHRALLVTRALDGYRSLEEWYLDWHRLPARNQKCLTISAAKLVARLHKTGLIHNSLYPKHIFIRLDEQGTDARLIDLETARPNWWGWRDRVRDLEVLHRRSGAPGTLARRLFMRHYLGEQPQLHRQEERLTQAILARTQRRKPAPA